MWHTGRLCGFDLETTAPDPETARIVSACVVQCGGGQPTASAVWLSDADGETIPREAEKIHGITTGIAHTQGQPLAEVVQEILTALTQVTLSGIPVVAMNARYDFTVLDREARRFGHTPLTDTAEGLAVVDPFVLDKHVDTYRRGSRKLTALCAHYDVRIGQRHPRLSAMTPEALHSAQVGWAAEQAASLQEHFRKSDPAAVVEPAWPLVPAAEVSV